MKRIGTRALALAAVVAVAAASVAHASSAEQPATSYHGCIDNKGKLYRVTPGEPAADFDCKNDHQMITLGVGDITSVAAGEGLVGRGGDSGSVGLSIARSFQLPQGCESGQVARLIRGEWACANAQARLAGPGLVLDGNELGVSPGFQLPQGCDDGDQIRATSSGWECSEPAMGLAALATAPNASVSGGIDKTPDGKRCDLPSNYASGTPTYSHETLGELFWLDGGTYLASSNDLDVSIHQYIDGANEQVMYGGIGVAQLVDNTGTVATQHGVELLEGIKDNQETAGVFTVASPGRLFQLRMEATARRCTTVHVSGGFAITRIA